MISLALTSFAVAALAPSPTIPREIDPELVDYFTRAIGAHREGQVQKGIGMLKLLLLPEPTGFTVDYSGLDAPTVEVFRRGVERGIGLWRQALGSDMPFRPASRAVQPDVVIRFVDRIAEGVGRCKGEIRAKRWIQWNDQVHYVQFTATISICKNADSRLMNEDEITHIVAHEIGHALGLGDTPKTGVVMGPIQLGNPYSQIHPNEVAAVKSLRQIVRGQLAALGYQKQN